VTHIYAEPSVVKFTETESRMWREGPGDRDSVGDCKKALEMVVMVTQQCEVHNYILKRG
jgi:hypothetical protein